MTASKARVYFPQMVGAQYLSLTTIIFHKFQPVVFNKLFDFVRTLITLFDGTIHHEMHEVYVL